MGCTQTSANAIVPHNVPIEQLYAGENNSTTNVSPIVTITAPPIPAYVKSVLKKTNSDERTRSEGLSFLTRRRLSVNKSVNFDDQVLVKARTPTPNKTWYEKKSSTMPMRKHRRNDDDADDYDDEEVEQISSDEEQENNEQITTEPQIPIPGPPVLLQRNQPNTFWHNGTITGLMSTTNATLKKESFPLTTQQPSYNMNAYETESLITPPINRIKVRRRLSHSDVLQIAPTLSYKSPLQSSISRPFPSSTQTSTFPAYKIPARTSFITSHQSPIRPLSVLPNQSSIPSSSQSFHIKRTWPSTNTVLMQNQPTLTNTGLFSQPTSHVFNQRPIENVT